MKAVAQEPSEDVVERLEAVLAELEGRLPLPAGAVGAGLLDALEAANRLRRVVRAEAKTLLRKAPGALPGWRVITRNGAPEREDREPRLMIRSHHRSSAVRLIQRPHI